MYDSSLASLRATRLLIVKKPKIRAYGQKPGTKTHGQPHYKRLVYAIR